MTVPAALPSVAVPARFDTPRLTLRCFRPEDAPELQAAWTDSRPELLAQLWFIPWVAEAPTAASALARCIQAQENFLQRTDLAYLAFERQSGRLVGSFGLHRTDWWLPKTEVGYWVRTGHTGQGFATEGVQALVAWARDELGAVRIELLTDALNHGSRAVAQRCGFVLEGHHHHVMRAPDGGLRDRCVYAQWSAGRGASEPHLKR